MDITAKEFDKIFDEGKTDIFEVMDGKKINLNELKKRLNDEVTISIPKNLYDKIKQTHTNVNEFIQNLIKQNLVASL